MAFSDRLLAGRGPARLELFPHRFPARRAAAPGPGRRRRAGTWRPGTRAGTIMGHAYKRAERVGQAMQEELGRMLLRDLKDPRIGRVTVMRVQVTDDLKHARAFVAVAGDAAAEARALEGLRSAAGFLRGELARRLNLRYAPAVQFEADRSLDAMQRLGELFRAMAPGGAEGEEEA